MTAPNGDLVILSCVSDFVNLLLYYGTQVYVCVFVYSVVLCIYCSAYILYFVKKLYMQDLDIYITYVTNFIMCQIKSKIITMRDVAIIGDFSK